MIQQATWHNFLAAMSNVCYFCEHGWGCAFCVQRCLKQKKRYAVLLVESEDADSDCCALRNTQADPCSLVADIFQSGRVLAMLGARTQPSVWVGVHRH